jgi:hypothetical protein
MFACTFAKPSSDTTARPSGAGTPGKPVAFSWRTIGSS